MQEKIAKPGARKVRMVRKQILITPEQSRRLREVAAVLGLPEAEVIRRGLEAFVGRQASESHDWRAQLRQVLASIGSDADLAARVEDNKSRQSQLWRERLGATKRAARRK